MATVNASKVAHATLTAATEDVVTLARNYRGVRVFNRGSGDIFFTTDNTAMTAAPQTDAYVVPSNMVVEAPNGLPPNEPAANVTNQTVVRLYSAGTPSYTVQGL